jgi:hypothetical protein
MLCLQNSAAFGIGLIPYCGGGKANYLPYMNTTFFKGRPADYMNITFFKGRPADPSL